MEWINELPELLEPVKDKILETKRSFIEIIPAEGAPERPWKSRFGGNPYLPKDTAWPVSPEGQQLFFLAQINFAEMPPLSPFPSKGILQFYIDDDDLYGLSETDLFKQDYFRVLYFPEVIEDPAKLTADFSFLRSFEDLPVYPGQSFGMEFHLGEECVSVSDYHFPLHFGEGFFAGFGEAQWEIFEWYAHEVSSEGHKVGGYAHFAQQDPRRAEDNLVLLFQMDTDAEMECMWGDMGTAKFFISEQDLKDLNFSRVMYYWDCF